MCSGQSYGKVDLSSQQDYGVTYSLSICLGARELGGCNLVESGTPVAVSCGLYVCARVISGPDNEDDERAECQ